MLGIIAFFKLLASESLAMSHFLLKEVLAFA